MIRVFVIIPLLFLIVLRSNAQTKIFKEISDEVSSQVNAIMQDNAVVGYLVFTQLEQAGPDLYNYKITILDENLNDIGAVTFKDEKLYLKAVSFDQDVLCLAYLKSNILYREFKTKREYQNLLPNARNSLFLQFLNLNGHIINSDSIKLDIKPKKDPIDNIYSLASNRFIVMADARIKNDVRLKNLPQNGFAILYGDDTKNSLIFFDNAGKQTWQKVLEGDFEAMDFLQSNQDIYVLTKKKEKMNEGGWEFRVFSNSDTMTYPPYSLKDKHGNSLNVIMFANDPATGTTYFAGNIIDSYKGNNHSCGSELAKGPYAGLYTLSVADYKNHKINETYTYWNDGSQSTITRKGFFRDNKSYIRIKGIFKDQKGNTCFIASAINKRPKWAVIIASIITAPLIIPPIAMLPTAGVSAYKVSDVVLLSQDKKGNLSLEQSIPANNSRLYHRTIILSNFDTRKIYHILNGENKTDFLVVDDVKDIFIYNVEKKKLMRTIPHKDGQIRTSIYPAKPGHVLVVEHDKKEKNVRVSIESL